MTSWRILVLALVSLNGSLFSQAIRRPLFPSGPVTLDSHNLYASGTLSSCAAGATSCQITTTFNIPHTGDAVIVSVSTCFNTLCALALSGTPQ